MNPRSLSSAARDQATHVACTWLNVTFSVIISHVEPYPGSQNNNNLVYIITKLAGTPKRALPPLTLRRILPDNLATAVLQGPITLYRG